MGWTILLTRGLVLACYLAVFIYAAVILCMISGNWSRKATLVIFMIISGYWAAFYVHLLVTQWDGLTSSSSAIAMWSRVGHVGMAIGMWTIISFLNMVSKEYSLVAVGKEFE